MIVVAVIPLVLLVIGLLMYALAANPKVSELGRIMFFCGLLALALVLAKTVFRIG